MQLNILRVYEVYESSRKLTAMDNGYDSGNQVFTMNASLCGVKAFGLWRTDGNDLNALII